MNSDSVDLIYLGSLPSIPTGPILLRWIRRPVGASFKDTWTIVRRGPGLASRSRRPGARALCSNRTPRGPGARCTSMKSYLIMMAVRLLEMRRILRGTGSIYLHCDPTASHYLKLVMALRVREGAVPERDRLATTARCPIPAGTFRGTTTHILRYTKSDELRVSDGKGRRVRVPDALRETPHRE